MKNKELGRPFFQAVTKRLSKYACVLMSDGGKNVFSGSLVREGGRHFVLTVQHGIRDIVALDTFAMSTLANHGKHISLTGLDVYEHPEMDMALIELSDSAVKAAAGEDRELLAGSSERVDWKALAGGIGFPGSLCLRKEGNPPTLHPTPFSYGSEVTTRDHVFDYSKWRFEETREFFIEWDPNNLVCALEGEKVSAIEPYGMSGMGVFLIPKVGSDEIWSPTNMCLAGVATHVLPDERLIRCARVEYAAEMLGYTVVATPGECGPG